MLVCPNIACSLGQSSGFRVPAPSASSEDRRAILYPSQHAQVGVASPSLPTGAWPGNFSLHVVSCCLAVLELSPGWCLSHDHQPPVPRASEALRCALLPSPSPTRRPGSSWPGVATRHLVSSKQASSDQGVPQPPQHLTTAGWMVAGCLAWDRHQSAPAQTHCGFLP